MVNRTRIEPDKCYPRLCIQSFLLLFYKKVQGSVKPNIYNIRGLYICMYIYIKRKKENFFYYIYNRELGLNKKGFNSKVQLRFFLVLQKQKYDQIHILSSASKIFKTFNNF